MLTLAYFLFQEIIARVNADFQKVYFGITGTTEEEGGKGNRATPCEVEEMSYYGVLRRMCQLMYVHEEQRWIDPTFESRFVHFAARTFERFTDHNATASDAQEALVSDLFANETSPFPSATVAALLKSFPTIVHKILVEEDVDYFLHQCKFGGKPVNFIPVIDHELEYWFKKDSLWYSEDIAAVPERDAGRYVLVGGGCCLGCAVRTCSVLFVHRVLFVCYMLGCLGITFSLHQHVKRNLDHFWD